MLSRFPFLLMLCFLMFCQTLLAQDGGVVSVVSIKRELPPYPADCNAPSEVGERSAAVSVVYQLTATGRVKQSRVRESSDSCFNKAALEAVRSWTFEPRITVKQWNFMREFEAMFFFDFQQETKVFDFEIVAIKRNPPKFPRNCFSSASMKELVVISFDINSEGTTENVDVLSSTNSCFNRMARNAVKKWRYEPKIIDGAAVRRDGMETELTFEMSY